MKFSHSLKFNAVPEWSDHYLNYTSLKKVIYRLQQDQLKNQPQDGGFEVKHATPSMTVSDLVEQLREQSNNNHGKGGMKEQDRKFATRIMSRLRKGRGGDAGADEEKQVGSSGVQFVEVEVEEGEKKASSETYTVDLDVQTIISFDEKSNYQDPRSDNFDPLKVFAKQLLSELTKINEFYLGKERDVFGDFENLMKDLDREKIDAKSFFKSTPAYLQSQNLASLDPQTLRRLEISRAASPLSSTSNFDRFETTEHEDVEKHLSDQYDMERDSDDEEDDDEHSQNTALLNHSDLNVKEQKKITLRKMSVNLFISLSELKSFIELNKIGFTKITKKFDKTCNFSIKKDFIDIYLPCNSKIFRSETIGIVDAKLNEVVKVYALLSGQLSSKTTLQDLESIRNELKSYLRDHIVWERNTVWKDLLSLEKRYYNLNLNKNATQSNKMGDEASVNMMKIQMSRVDLPWKINFLGRSSIEVPSFLLTWQVFKILVTVLVFIILMSVKTFNDPEQHRCLAVLVALAMLWASEAMPLYITGMLVPFLVVVCKVLKNDDENSMGGADAASYILSTMWSSVIMLLLGGFTLAAALSKYNIAKIVSSYILAVAGTKPRNVLISIMSVSLFLSMWISNVAAPVLCYSLIQPVLRTVPTDSPFAQALVLGIALASNVAGMASPIASPQNMVAIESMNPNPGWGKWFAIALPVSIVAMLGIWVELFMTFNISTVKLKAYKPIKEKFTIKQIYISVVTIATILLWCLLTNVEGAFGNSGIISVIPIVLFFGTGLLNVDDLNNFPWSIILLAMGGIALGKAVSSSGLLNTVATALQHKIEDFNVFVIMMIFGLLVLVVATFVSHTVAALIIIPLVKEVGENLPTPHPLILVMGTALIASAAMGLPTSGFPNVTAISMTDEVGKRYLTVNTFITRGVPASIIAYLCVITLGYGIMTSLDF